MKTLFELEDFEAGLQQSAFLLCELGESYCFLTALDRNKKVKALRVITFSKIELDTSVDALLNTLAGKTNDLEKVVVSSAFPQAVLVPLQFYDKDVNYTEAIFDNKAVHHMHDEIKNWQMVNVYALPQTVYKKFVQAEPDALFIHSYTCAIHVFNGVDAPDQLDVNFISDHFRVIVKKGGQLALAQMYNYTSPLDVVYYLLKIIKEFSLSQKETAIILSGFIDKDSSLYKEIDTYFSLIYFKNAEDFELPESDHPQHYFASINNLLSCVL